MSIFEESKNPSQLQAPSAATTFTVLLTSAATASAQPDLPEREEEAALVPGRLHGAGVDTQGSSPERGDEHLLLCCYECNICPARADKR